MPIHFHYSDDYKRDCSLYEFLSVFSFIQLNNDKKIYFHYKVKPEGHYWSLLEPHIVPLLWDGNKESIFQLLRNNGGFYIEFGVFCIQPINLFDKYSFIKSIDSEVIMMKKKIDNDSIVIKEPIFITYNLKDIDKLFSTIDNYEFQPYFSIIKNTHFIFIEELIFKIKYKQIVEKPLFEKQNLFFLLLRHIFSYPMINHPQQSLSNIQYSKDDIEFFLGGIDCINWINLDDCFHRQEKMKEVLNILSIPSNRISAIDGRLEEDVSQRFFKTTDDIFPNQSNKEYAVLLSHLKAITHYCSYEKSDLNHGVGMICEDDLSLDFLNYWEKPIFEIISELPETWEILMLGYFSTRINNIYNLNNQSSLNNQLNQNNLPNQKNNSNIYYYPWSGEWNANAYLINYENVKKKISTIFDSESGKYICDSKDIMVADNYIFSKFNTFVTHYPYFTFPNENDSTFHEDHLQYHKLYKCSNYIVLEKMIENIFCYE